jgi:hypothetical protein
VPRPSLVLVALAALAASFAATFPAWAWVEAHVIAHDARLSIDRTAVARVEHRFTLRITGGPLRSYDVRGVDLDALLDSDAYVVAARDAQTNSLASAIPVAADRVEPEADDPELSRLGGQRADKIPGVTVRLRFADRGLGRGLWVIVFRYKTDLGQRGLLRRDAGAAHLAWTGPVWDDGLESARATLLLPAAPTEPTVEDAAPDADTGDAPVNGPTFLSTLRRTADGDELSLLRPYVPKGDAVTWRVRVDPRAFVSRSSEPTGNAAPLTLQSVVLGRRGALIAGAAALFVGFALLVALKTREAKRSAISRGAEARPLLPLPMALRAVAAGLLLMIGVALQLKLESGTAGAIAVLAAVAFAAHRSPRWRQEARGPGKWLTLSEQEAFARPPRPRGGWLDSSTDRGKVILIWSLIALGGCAWAVSQASMYHAYLVGFDAVALLAIFGTGRQSQLPPDPVAGRAPLLRDIARRLARHLRKLDAEGLRVVPRIRVPAGSGDADELRLLIVPRAPLQGFGGIEVGAVIATGSGVPILLPEVLLRVTEGSECERAAHRLVRHGRSTRGRRPGEQVIAFSPRLPTARMTAAIAAALAVRTSSGTSTRDAGAASRAGSPTETSTSQPSRRRRGPPRAA